MGMNIQQLGFAAFSEFLRTSQLEADYSFISYQIIDAVLRHGI